jgi:hypothetical protein
MTYNILKVRNTNGNLRLRYSGGVLHEKGSLNGRKLPMILNVRVKRSPEHVGISLLPDIGFLDRHL